MLGILWINMFDSAPVPANIQLPPAIEEEWTYISQATINSLLNSMHTRCGTLQELNSHTKLTGFLIHDSPTFTLFSGVSVTLVM